jgi:hypothetical protein
MRLVSSSPHGNGKVESITIPYEVTQRFLSRHEAGIRLSKAGPIRGRCQSVRITAIVVFWTSRPIHRDHGNFGCDCRTGMATSNCWREEPQS